jgi:hypothetical protein
VPRNVELRGCWARSIRTTSPSPSRMLAVHGLACRTQITVGLGLIGERIAVEQGAIALVVDGASGGHMRNQPGCFQAARLLTVGVPGIGDDVDGSLCFQRHTGSLGHTLETVVIA